MCSENHTAVTGAASLAYNGNGPTVGLPENGAAVGACGSAFRGLMDTCSRPACAWMARAAIRCHVAQSQGRACISRNHHGDPASSLGNRRPLTMLRVAEAKLGRTSEHDTGAPPRADLRHPQRLSTIKWRLAMIMRTRALRDNNFSPTAKEQN